MANGLNIPSLDSEHPTEEAIKGFLSALFNSRSAICMLQIQDLFALDSTICHKDIHFERINIPGTVQEVNWSYRINHTLEELIQSESLINCISSLIEPRKTQKISI